MLDLTGILVSSIMMLIVIARAVQLDERMPWFETAPPSEKTLSGLELLRVKVSRQIPAWRRRT